MSQGVRGNNGALNNHTEPRLWWGVMKNLNREVEKVRKATWHIKSFNSIRGRRFCLRFFFCLEKKDKRLQGGFIMQRHSGRDWVGVLRHTEEQECVATGRDRQNSSAECGKKKGEVKKRKPTFTAHVQLHNPSIFRPSLNKIWKIQFAFVLLSENWTGVLAFAYFWVSTGCKQQKNFCYLKRKKKKKSWECCWRVSWNMHWCVCGSFWQYSQSCSGKFTECNWVRAKFRPPCCLQVWRQNH